MYGAITRFLTIIIKFIGRNRNKFLIFFYLVYLMICFFIFFVYMAYLTKCFEAREDIVPNIYEPVVLLSYHIGLACILKVSLVILSPQEYAVFLDFATKPIPRLDSVNPEFILWVQQFVILPLAAEDIYFVDGNFLLLCVDLVGWFEDTPTIKLILRIVVIYIIKTFRIDPPSDLNFIEWLLQS